MNERRPSRTRIIPLLGVPALLMTLVLALLTSMATPSGASTNDEQQQAVPTFASEARAQGLTSDQSEQLATAAQREVVRTRGTRTGLNEVSWAGGRTVLPLPGEKVARNLDPTSMASRSTSLATNPTLHGCVSGRFCVYEGYNFTGTRHDMYRCGVAYDTEPYWFGSYTNNQTGGASAEFLDVYSNHLTWSYRPVFASNTSWGARTFAIIPC